MKTSESFLLTAALLVGCLAMPAGAQVPVAPPDEVPIPSKPEDVLKVHNFAACAAKFQPRAARELLAIDYRTDARAQALVRFADDTKRCAPRGISRFNRRFFAGRLAEALLRKDLGGKPLGARIALDPARPPIEARDEAELMSICTVRAEPAATGALFETKPASPAETKAIQALTPQIGRCLAAGATAKLNRAAIRSMLALAAYRLSEHNHPSTGTAQ